MIVARSAAAERQFSADFEARRIEKEYLALVEGVVEAGRITVNCPIGPGRKGKMRATAPRGDEPRERRPRPALTVFETIERFDSLTLLRARPLTGRTHQIRVHAWAMGHPLAVDPLYRFGNVARRDLEVPGIARLTLHAERYTLPPEWDAPRTFVCPLASDFAAALERLRGEAPC